MGDSKNYMWFVYIGLLFALFQFGGRFTPVGGLIALLVASAWISRNSAARKAGVIACALWIAYAVCCFMGEKYLGPIGFAASSALIVAATSVRAARLARCMLLPIVFIETAWIASLVRQLVYEIERYGHTTGAVDACATAFLPIDYIVLSVFVLATGAGASLVASINVASTGPEAATSFRQGVKGVSFVIALVGGAIVGLSNWHDWQINQPCL
jgi:hypothetical protein